jgi:hypothetical protein
MTTSFQALRNAMAGPPGTEQEPRWGDLMMELWPVISAPLTWEGERLLLDLIRFEGRLRVAVSSEMPHSMPPEDMLKSLVIQALARWTGLVHLHEMQRVQLTTRSSSLASLVADVIQKARETHQGVRTRTATEEIAESSPQAASKVVPRWLERDQGMSFVAGRRFRVRQRERELVC